MLISAENDMLPAEQTASPQSISTGCWHKHLWRRVGFPSMCGSACLTILRHLRYMQEHKHRCALAAALTRSSCDA